MPDRIHGSRRWLALLVLCLGVVMIVLDATVVTVALPTIRTDLGFSETSLVWVVNAYVLPVSGFMLLGGRLGDLYGARKLFLIGIVAFTLASLGCGLATSQAALIWARAVQGFGGAVVDAVSLSLIMNMFTEPDDRAKAMGVFGFILSTGGSIGLILGGVITIAFNWHWIFLINVPVGVFVYVLSLRLVPATRAQGRATGRLDLAGALTMTTSLMLAVYAIINGDEAGWWSKQSVGSFSAAVVLLAVFLFIESRVRSPLVPLGLFRIRVLAVANVAAMLTSAAMCSGFFITLYLQRVLEKNSLEVALIFLPTSLVGAVLALGFSARIVNRFGIKLPFAAGLLLCAVGLALFSSAPVKGDLLTDVFPGLILLTIGGGIAFNPLVLAAMHGVDPKDSGLASGLVNTSSMMGGALGLAILASTAAAWMRRLSLSGVDPLVALNSGYHVAFAIGAVLAVAAAALGLVWLPATIRRSAAVPASAQ
jgi:EmrB/QacA subfamily drug resistance transporter